MPDLPRIIHPGPPATARHSAVPCRATPGTVVLRGGRTLLDAMADAADGAAAWFDLSGFDVDRLCFVRPAPAPGDGHVAWYSATTTFEPGRILRAGAHLGRRDGAPFAHIHGVWADHDGRRHAGHLLPETTVLGRDAEVDVILLDGAQMDSADDPETRFRLFRPVRTARIENPNAILATARPHAVIEDIIGAIAREGGLDHAGIVGIGSLVGARFTDAGAIGSYATEVLLTQGRLSDGRVDLNAAAVGFDGLHAEGVLARSTNTVCVTFELLLVEGQCDGMGRARMGAKPR